MFNLIEKLSNNFVGTNQNKTQIILTHTSRDVEEYLTSLKYRMNGKYPRWLGHPNIIRRTIFGFFLLFTNK
jgi:hypothetical protein